MEATEETTATTGLTTASDFPALDVVSRIVMIETNVQHIMFNVVFVGSGNTSEEVCRQKRNLTSSLPPHPHPQQHNQSNKIIIVNETFKIKLINFNFKVTYTLQT